MIRQLFTDYVGVSHFGIDGGDLVTTELPWNERDFDVTLFIDHEVTEHEATRVIDSVLRFRPDWVMTTGDRAEYWHDLVDQRAVAAGMQAHVGDGFPMTAWLTDVAAPRDWRISCLYGGSEHHLFVFVGYGDVDMGCKEVQKTIQEAGKEEEAQPGATDNPDDAQRLREDY